MFSTKVTSTVDVPPTNTHCAGSPHRLRVTSWGSAGWRSRWLPGTSCSWSWTSLFAAVWAAAAAPAPSCSSSSRRLRRLSWDHPTLSSWALKREEMTIKQPPNSLGLHFSSILEAVTSSRFCMIHLLLLLRLKIWNIWPLDFRLLRNESNNKMP